MNRLILLAGFSLFSFSSMAWEKVISCGQESMVIDRDCVLAGEFPAEYACKYQMVIRNVDAIAMLTQNALRENELVVPVSVENGYGSFFGTNDKFIFNVSPIRDSSKLVVQTSETFFEESGPMTNPIANWVFEDCSLIRRY